MPVQLGAASEHGFDQPLGLLSDCHRRIERFLAILQRVLDDAGPGALDDPQRRAVETALTYFRTAAPRHTEDEEHSLFPLLRRSGQPQALRAMHMLDDLQRDHIVADAAHAEVERWYSQWLSDGHLPLPQREALGRALSGLREMYHRHIAVEEEQIFPLAAEVLDRDELAGMGREMAARRGLSPRPVSSITEAERSWEDASLEG